MCVIPIIQKVEESNPGSKSHQPLPSARPRHAYACCNTVYYCQGRYGHRPTTTTETPRHPCLCRTMGKSNDDVKGSDNDAADNSDSFPEHSLPPPPPESLTKTSSAGNRTTLATIAGVAGNVLEWYDFAIFGYFSDVIGDVFFPPQSGHAALAQSFAVFGGAFLARPRKYCWPAVCITYAHFW